MQLFDLPRHDGPSAAAVNSHMAGVSLVQHLAQVLKELHMPALVAGDRYPLSILLNSRVDNLLHATVVPQVNHLGARSLEDASHDVDRGIMTVEERGCGDDANRIFGLVGDGVGHVGTSVREDCKGPWVTPIARSAHSNAKAWPSA